MLYLLYSLRENDYILNNTFGGVLVSTGFAMLGTANQELTC